MTEKFMIRITDEAVIKRLEEMTEQEQNALVQEMIECEIGHLHDESPEGESEYVVVLNFKNLNDHTKQSYRIIERGTAEYVMVENLINEHFVD